MDGGANAVEQSVNVSPVWVKRMQTGTWVSVYAGVVSVGLGISVDRRSESLGWPFVVEGLALIFAGIVLIALRSRMRIAGTGASAGNDSP